MAKEPSALEAQLIAQMTAYQFPKWEREFQFCDGRKWAADFAWPELGLLVEVDGGAWNQGRHSRAAGRASDCVRDAEAFLLGYTTIRLTTQMVTSGKGVRLVERVIDYLRE